MSDAFPTLTDAEVLGAPFTLPCGGILKNRIGKSAMSEQLGDVNGAPSEALIRLYSRWARGGTGLLVTGNVMVDAKALGEPSNVVVEDERDLARLQRWARAAAGQGAQVWMQLNHPGRQSPRLLSPEPVAPSAVPLELSAASFAPPRALTGDEIDVLVQRFARSAAVAKLAGFTGVQVHAAHGYLISQFLSPKVNQRDDVWGGSPARRRKFLLDIVTTIRAAVGPTFPVGVKLNSADFQRGGIDEEETLDVVSALADVGVDLLEISGGNYEAPAMITAGVKESTRRREAYFLAFAERVRQRTRIPLMVTGGFRTASGMAAALRSDATDIIGMARPLATDPDLPQRLLAGDAGVGPIEPRKTGIRRLDTLAEMLWYGQQIRRMGAGKEPNPTMTAWGAIMGGMWTHGVNLLRRVRA